MIKTALWPLQQAVFARLQNDPILTGMVDNVYDEIPQKAKLPYVSIGDDTVNPYDTKTSYGEDLTLTLHAWSGGPGKTEAKHIMGAILQAMSAAPLTIEGFEVEGIRRDFLEVFSDGQAYHGVCRFRVYVKQL
jgi:hypothetical protein